MAQQDLTRGSTPHSLMMEGRERLSISGVEDVESFNEDSVVVYTSRGTLVIHGTELHIERLSLDMGELALEGEVTSLEYIEESTSKNGGFFGRLFR